MKNKDLKKGDKIWILSDHMRKEEGLVIKSIKKRGTLVSIVAEKWFDKTYDVQLYGHASSHILSGYDKKARGQSLIYTCDHSYVEQETKDYEANMRLIKGGKILQELVDFLK